MRSALGWVGWFAASAVIAGFLNLNGEATGTLGLLIFLGGLVAYLAILAIRKNLRVERNTSSADSIDHDDAYTDVPKSCVYLLKAGPFYKIGKSQNFEKRLNQIKLQLPYPVAVIHVFRTTDISDVETYWHKRFQNKRTNGEWFLLTDDDVIEFREQH